MSESREKIWSGKRARRTPEFEVISDANREPPHSAEAEDYLISCALLDGSDTIAKCVSEKISAEAFYSRANSLIWDVIVDLYRKSPPVDILMLISELKKRELLEQVGGLGYVTAITSRISTSAQVPYFIARIKETWILRELIQEATEAIENCHSFTGVEENALENLLAPVATRFSRAIEFVREGSETMQAKAQRGYEYTLLKMQNKHDTTRQIWTGMAEFDRRFGAFDVKEEDWLIGIAALTSGGKSAFTRKIMDYNLNAGKHGAVFLLETSLAKYLDLAACTAAHVNGRYLHELTKEDAARFRAEREKRQAWVGERLWIYDDNAKAETLVSRIDDHVRQHGRMDFVVIDHLHELYSTKNFKGNREAELGYIAKLLKKTAKRLDTPFFVPTQLNRSPARDGQFRRPNKHDLRGSGEIEAAYDRLILLYTPKEDMRGIEQTDNQQRVMVEVIQDKSRNGPLGHREFWFDRPYTDYIEVRESEFGRRSTAPAPSAGPTKGQFMGDRP